MSSVQINKDNLLYYYPFDTDTLDYASGTGVSDASATNVSVSNSTTILTSGSLYFSGTSTAAFQIPNTTFTAGGITVMFWAKLVSLNPSATVKIFDFGSGVGTYNFAGQFANNAFTLSQIGTYVSSQLGSNGTAYSVKDTNWHHYCITLSTCPQITVYVDGIQSQNAPNSGYPTLTTITPCYLGKRTDGGTTYLNAYMNQFILFNRVLSYTEIINIYSNPTNIQFVTVTTTPSVPAITPIINNSKLLAYYPLDTDLYDYTTGTGVNNSTATNTSISSAATVMSSGSLYMTGLTATQGLALKTMTFDGSGMTFSFWMKIVQLPKTNMTIFDLNGTNGNVTLNINTSAGTLGISMRSPSIQSQSTAYAFSFQINDANWHHYCITIATTGFITTYMDRNNRFFANYPMLYPALTSYTSCLIGKSNTGSNNTTYGTPNFYMNHFVIMNRVISSTELYTLSTYPNYLQFSSSASNILSILDSYVVPKNLQNGEVATVNVDYTSQYLTGGTTYSLKNAGLSIVAAAKLYNGYDTSFSMVSCSGNGALTVDASGYIYTFCDSSYGIYIYNPSGTLVRSISTPNIFYDSMAYDASANLIYCAKHSGTPTSYGVLNPTTYDITDMSVNLNPNTPFTELGISPGGILYGTSNFSGGGFCSIEPLTGVSTKVYSSAVTPQFGNLLGTASETGGLTYDGSGNFYISITNNAANTQDIIKIKSDFTYVSYFTTCPCKHMTCDTNTGYIYTINRNGTVSNAIYRISPTGFVSIYTILPSTPLAILYDKYSNKLLVKLTSTLFRFNLQNIYKLSYSFSSTSLTAGNNTLQLYDSGNNASGIPINISVSCFLEGTKILCLDSSLSREEYVSVEHLTKDRFVKTYKSGYIRVDCVGNASLFNPNAETEAKNRLYVYRRGAPTEGTMTEDLYITGNHSVLVDEFANEAQEKKVREHMGDVYLTEGLYRLPACLDERAEPFFKPGEYKIWHFALENDDIYANYGVYANGVLAETSSIRYLTELSNMKIK